MRQLTIGVVIALVLGVAAALSVREARRLRVEADDRERLATLRHVGSDNPKSEYWRGEYERVLPVSAPADRIDRDADWERLLLAANAAFRKTQRESPPRQAHLQQLDAVLQSYASVLKSGPFVADAAYNYEFVARLREAVSRGKPPASATARASGPTEPRAVDLPAGPTIHGRPGGPPPGTKGEEFEIIAPMEFGDREAQPEPNAGGKPLRKG
jgi:hypothetical protein